MSMMRFVFVIISVLLICAPNRAKAQAPLDAKQLLQQLEERTYQSSSDEKVLLADSLVEYFTETRDSCALIKAMLYKAMRKYGRAKYESQLEWIVAADKIYTQTKCDPQIEAALLYSKAEFRRRIGELNAADSLARRGISLFKPSWKEKAMLIKLYLILGNSQPEFENAIQAFDSAFAIATRHKKDGLIPSIYISLGTEYALNEDFAKAKEYFLKALPLIKRSRQKDEIGTLYNNLAGLSEDPDEILGYIDSAIHYAKSIDDIISLQTFKENKAFFYTTIGDYEKGYQELYEALVLKDSVLNEKKIQAVTEIQEKYEAGKRANEIQELKVDKLNEEVQKIKYRRNQNILILGTLSLLVVLISLYIGYASMKKNRNTLVRTNKLIARERERSDELLLNILPKQIAEELKTSGSARAKRFDHVTIMFTDFRRFTQISEQLPAEDLVKELNACFQAFDTICETYGLEKIKTIGDSYMVAAGLEQSSIGNDGNSERIKKSAENMIRAAIEMQNFVIRRWQREDIQTLGFQMRCGIHTGSVVAGIVGKSKFQYDIWGDSVNTASRMESTGIPDHINISEATYNLTKHVEEFDFDYRGQLEARGKGKMNMYFVSSKDLAI